jgi:hypothetical protein
MGSIAEGKVVIVTGAGVSAGTLQSPMPRPAQKWL